VVITPGEKRGESHATLRGELMAILDLAAGRRISPKTEVVTNALAGHRFEPTFDKFLRRRIGGNIADLRRVLRQPYETNRGSATGYAGAYEPDCRGRELRPALVTRIK